MPAKGNFEVCRYAGLYLRLLRVRMQSFIPSFLFLRRGTGMSGNLQRPAE